MPLFQRTITHITAAAAVVQNHVEVAEMAAATGRADEAAHYAALAERLKAQYHSAFYDPAGQVYGDGTSTAFACALWLGVTPPPLLPAVVDNFVRHLASHSYSMLGMGFIGVRYVFEALAKVNRTDVALRMFRAREWPSYGWALTNPIEQGTTLWESLDAPTMQQWFGESSRNHHFQASVSTFLRKYFAGLDQPEGTSGWAVVKVQPEAAHHSDLITEWGGGANLQLRTSRGLVVCKWESSLVAPATDPWAAGGASATSATSARSPSPASSSSTPATKSASASASDPPSPEPEVLPKLCAYTPQFPVPMGGLEGPAPATLRCPAGSTVHRVVYARWGHPVYEQPLQPAGRPITGKAWFCFGPQPPPEGTCEADVGAQVSSLCAGKQVCDLGPFVNASVMGDPCHLGPHANTLPLPAVGYQLIARVECSASAGGSSGSGSGSGGSGSSNERSDPSSESSAEGPSAPLTARERALLADGSIFRMNVTVPPGSTGLIHVPIPQQPQQSQEASITESGIVVWHRGKFVPGAAKGVSGAPSLTDGRFVAFRTLSGNYTFAAIAAGG